MNRKDGKIIFLLYDFVSEFYYIFINTILVNMDNALLFICVRNQEQSMTNDNLRLNTTCVQCHF